MPPHVTALVPVVLSLSLAGAARTVYFPVNTSGALLYMGDGPPWATPR